MSDLCCFKTYDHKRDKRGLVEHGMGTFNCLMDGEPCAPKQDNRLCRFSGHAEVIDNNAEVAGRYVEMDSPPYAKEVK